MNHQLSLKNQQINGFDFMLVTAPDHVMKLLLYIIIFMPIANIKIGDFFFMWGSYLQIVCFNHGYAVKIVPSLSLHAHIFSSVRWRTTQNQPRIQRLFDTIKRVVNKLH